MKSVSRRRASTLVLSVCATLTVAVRGRAQGPTLQIAKTLWSVGVDVGDSKQEFGTLIDAAIGPDSTVYLLDRAAWLIRVVDKHGRTLGTASRRGRGPGELESPTELIFDGASTLYVLDATNGLVEFRARDGRLTHVRTIVLPVTRVSSLCVSEDRFVVYAAVADTAVLHTITRQGALLRSWGTALGPREFPPAARVVASADGRVACLHGTDAVFAVAGERPEIRAYKSRTGTLLWADSLRNFKAPALTAVPGVRGVPRVTQSFSAGAFDSNIQLHALSARVVLSQAARTNREMDNIFSRLLDASTGAPLVLYDRDGAPHLNALYGFRGVLAVAIENKPYPTARLVEISYRDR